MFVLNQYVILILAFSVPGESKTLKKRDVIFPFGCTKFYIEILVSPLEFNEDRYPLKLQWEHALFEEGDWIGLFRENPETHAAILEPLVAVSVNKENGSYLTVSYNPIVSPEKLGYHGRCVNYYAGYFDKCHNIYAVTCLRIEPDWMWRLRNKIGRKKIKNTFIPGTHESAWISETLVKLPKKIKFSAQHEGILGQLIYGSRYINLRVKYISEAYFMWWACHFYRKLIPLKVILKEIRHFIENTKEVVILDFKEFQGFDEGMVHVKFIDYLYTELGDLVVPNKLNWDSTFNQVWFSRKRLIIAYNHHLARGSSTFLWDTVGYKRYKGKNLTGLQNYLTDLYESPPQTAWTAVLDLNPLSQSYDFLRIHDTTKYLDFMNAEITKWYKQKNWLKGSNIVSVNFLKSTGIVRAAIEYNSGQCS